MTRIIDTAKRAAATLTDTLAAIGERFPGVTSLTVSVAGMSITVTPKPDPPPACPTCGKPR